MALLAVLVLSRTAAAEEDEPADKSPPVAFALSIGATAVGAAALTAVLLTPERTSYGELFGLGLPATLLLTTGPAWGHFYSGATLAGVAGSTARLVGGALIGSDLESTRLAGYAIVFGSALAEIIDAPFAAQRATERNRLVVAPIVTDDEVGASLVGAF